uniref:HMG box domain-containing protein n=1 Tax=Glossina pallidipes TaxID=7398 RepID=A0A1A9Z729_GLOPL
MNRQFHIPSQDDEIVDLTDVGSNSNSATNAERILPANKSMHQPEQLQNRKIREVNNTLKEICSSHVPCTAMTNHHNFDSQNRSAPKYIIISTPINTPVASREQAKFPTKVNNGNACDPNEPTKPISAYSMFFRDTVNAIKHENPGCTFAELSRIVASMWDVLDPIHKNVYNKRNEMARHDYVKRMAIYRRQILEQQEAKKVQEHEKKQTQALAGNELKCSSQQIQGTSASNPINMYAHETCVNLNVNGEKCQQHHSSIQEQQLTQCRNTLTAAKEKTSVIMSMPASVVSKTSTITSPVTPSTLDKQTPDKASPIQMCIRENCKKRAIINPDWEDEYCSNECVVLHCRNVFNSWVQSKDK